MSIKAQRVEGLKKICETKVSFVIQEVATAPTEHRLLSSGLHTEISRLITKQNATTWN